MVGRRTDKERVREECGGREGKGKAEEEGVYWWEEERKVDCERGVWWEEKGRVEEEGKGERWRGTEGKGGII